MLSRILTASDCAQCRNCCVFHETSRWETPVVSKEQAEKICKALQKDDAVVPVQDSYAVQTVLRDGERKEGVEPYRCVALDEKSGCRLSVEEKPFDCSLWPLRVMKSGEEIYIAIAKGCVTVTDTFIEKVNTLLEEGLKEQILKQVSMRPDMIKPYMEGYQCLVKITENVNLPE